MLGDFSNYKYYIDNGVYTIVDSSTETTDGEVKTETHRYQFTAYANKFVFLSDTTKVTYSGASRWEYSAKESMVVERKTVNLKTIDLNGYLLTTPLY